MLTSTYNAKHILALFALLLTSATSFNVWPAPTEMTDTTGAPTRPLSQTFTIKSIGLSSPVLNAAIVRYLALLQPNLRLQSSTTTLPSLTTLTVNITTSTAPFTFNQDESYILQWKAASSTALLTASQTVGALRGLESFAQLVEPDPVYKQLPLEIPAVDFVITDSPRFPYRGLMMDLSRHFYSIQFIQHTIDTMVSNKLNVLHLHLTDDQSFPVESSLYPELANKGAFSRKTMGGTGIVLYTYSKQDLLALGTYALNRGVLLVPEFDMPAHSSSWGAGYPEIMVNGGRTNVSMGNGQCSKRLFQHGDTLNPIKNETYVLVDALLSEMSSYFPLTSFLHLGGDEVPTACWAGDKDINTWMANNNIKKGDYNALESYFVSKVHNGKGVKNTHKILMYWEEIFNNNVKLDKSSIVQAWKSTAMSGIIHAGYRTTNSYKWYLNHGCNNYGDGNWDDFYINDPFKWSNTNASAPPLTPLQKKLVLGGETTMWSECVDQYSFDSIVWPRTSAAAEQLWSSEKLTKTVSNATYRRMSEFRCRMVGRGVAAAPINDAVGSISPRDVNLGCM